jgi:hypothetical protein
MSGEKKEQLFRQVDSALRLLNVAAIGFFIWFIQDFYSNHRELERQVNENTVDIREVKTAVKYLENRR